MKSIIHLMSGGLDSTVCLRMLLDEGVPVRCLLVNYGQQHSKELWFAEYTCKRWKVPFSTIDLPKLGGLTEGSWIVPNRNCILLSLAVNLAVQHKADTVTIGCNKDDESMFPDCRMAFVQVFNTMLATAEVDVKALAPFWDTTKREIVAKAKTFCISIHDTWTCYRGGQQPCGECPACKKLEDALCST